MKVRIIQGKSVLYQGNWYNQGDEIEIGGIDDNTEGKVEVIEPKPIDVEEYNNIEDRKSVV